MSTWLSKNKLSLAVTTIVIVAVGVFVNRVRIPGHVDVITAQAMDMSQMHPPSGTALVKFATVQTGTISDTVTYTGTVKAYNEEDISARVTGQALSIPVYPGDTVHVGELVAQLDTAELGAKADQALADAQSAQDSALVAHLTHQLHHRAALDESTAQVQSAESALLAAQADAQNSQAAVSDAQAGVQSAIANSDYWKEEIKREKSLVDAGAVSESDYDSELSQSLMAASALSQANAKLIEANSVAHSSQAKVLQAASQIKAAEADQRMALADITIGQGQAQEAADTAVSADAAARDAQIVESYARITSLSNGIVIERLVAPGTLVQAGQTILKIDDIDKVRVQANVAVSDLIGLHPGTTVLITLPGASTGKPLLASVTSVFPSADPDTRTAVVEAVVPNPDHTLLPGAFATMKIARATYTDTLIVPADAVITQGGQNYLWVAQADTSPDTIYECVICHIHYSAKQALQFDYKDPMDGGDLIPMATPGSASAPSALRAHEVAVTLGASNGKWTEIQPGEVVSDERIVEQGQAGLTEGVRLATN
jgi:multidrug efflux pump subunit AcrA (membrane-fusion protein)